MGAEGCIPGADSEPNILNLCSNTWPWFLEALIGLVGGIIGYGIFISKKGKLEDIEDRDVAMFDELFQLDQQVKEKEQVFYDYANTEFPDYEECQTAPSRIRADVLRLASRQLQRGVQQAGKGQIGLRKSMIRKSNMAMSNELGGRLGQAKKHEMLLKQMYAIQKMKPIIESVIIGDYPSILPKSFESIGAAYANMATFGAKMFNGAYATLNYAIGDMIAQRDLARTYANERDNLRQEPVLTWSPERGEPAAPIREIATRQQRPTATDTFIEDFYSTDFGTEEGSTSGRQ